MLHARAVYFLHKRARMSLLKIVYKVCINFLWCWFLLFSLNRTCCFQYCILIILCQKSILLPFLSLPYYMYQRKIPLFMVLKYRSFIVLYTVFLSFCMWMIIYLKYRTQCPCQIMQIHNTHNFTQDIVKKKYLSCLIFSLFLIVWGTENDQQPIQHIQKCKYCVHRDVCTMDSLNVLMSI
jgi:hypothetical protein